MAFDENKNCCCSTCFKRNLCGGAGWYCDYCGKEPDKCPHCKINRGTPEVYDFEYNTNNETCSCRSCC